jgi:histidinol-phosphate aminotransferase
MHEGVIVRTMAGYGLHHYLRVSVGLASENEKFVKALTKILQ